MRGPIEWFQTTPYFSDAQHVYNVEMGDTRDWGGRYESARQTVLDFQQKKADVKLILAGILGLGSLAMHRPWMRALGLVTAGLIAKKGADHNRKVYTGRTTGIPLTQLFDL